MTEQERLDDLFANLGILPAVLMFLIACVAPLIDWLQVGHVEIPFNIQVVFLGLLMVIPNLLIAYTFWINDRHMDKEVRLNEAKVLIHAMFNNTIFGIIFTVLCYIFNT